MMSRWFVVMMGIAVAAAACSSDDTPVDPPDTGVSNDAGTPDSGVDTTPPTVVSVTPEPGATDVALDANIFVEFSEPLNCILIDNTMVEILPQTPVGVACGGMQVTLTSSNAWTPSTEYTVTIRPEVPDRAGNVLAEMYRWMFTTGP